MLKVMKAKDVATLMGTLCGLSAIILALPPFHKYGIAMFLIFVGVIVDLLDGFIARLTGGGNAFGVELDSLSDGIVFGVAPALIAYMNYAVGSPDNGFLTTNTGISPHNAWFMLIGCFFLKVSLWKKRIV